MHAVTTLDMHMGLHTVEPNENQCTWHALGKFACTNMMQSSFAKVTDLKSPNQKLVNTSTNNEFTTRAALFYRHKVQTLLSESQEVKTRPL